MKKQLKDIFIPFGGVMNADDEPQLSPKGDYSYAANIMSEAGNYGAKTNVKGNKLVFDPATDMGLDMTDHEIIGACEDEDTGWVYYITSNDIDKYIFRYNVNGTCQKANTVSAYIPFVRSHKITDMNVIGLGDNKFIIATDNHNEPFKMPVYNLFDVVDPLYTDYPEQAHYANRVIKPSPIYQPLVSVSYNASYDAGNVYGVYFQFMYRYVYDAGEKSSWSCVSSAFRAPSIIDSFIGFVDSRKFNAYYNELILTLRKDSYFIDSVDIAVRVMDVEGTGVNGDWVLYDNISNDGSGSGSVGGEYNMDSFVYHFYNDKPGDASLITQEEFNKLYDNVPVKTTSLEVSASNRICFGGITKDWDPVDLGESNITQIQFIPNNTSQLGIFAEDVSEVVSLASVDIYMDFYPISLYFLVLIGNGVKEIYCIDVKDSIESLLDSVIEKININTSFDILVTGDYVYSHITITNNELYSIYTTFSFSDIAVNDPIGSYNIDTLKEGTTHYFGIRYRDYAGRCSPVYRNDNFNLFIERYPTNDWLKSCNYALISLYNIPPLNAVSFQFMYGGCGMYDWFHIPIVINNSTATSLDIDVIYNKDGRVAINLPQALLRAQGANLNKTIDEFDIAVGDYVVPIGYVNTIPHLTRSAYRIPNPGLGFKVIDIDGDGIVYIEDWSYSSYFNILNGSTGYDILIVEFYRNRSTDPNDIFYNEVGITYPVINGLHCPDVDYVVRAVSTWTPYGNTDQTIWNPASALIEFGNCYKKRLWICDFIDGFGNFRFVIPHVESKRVSALHNSKFVDLGRYGYSDSEEKQRYSNVFQWGGVLADGEFSFNEINKFNSEDYIYINDRYGKITKIIESGYIMNVFQDRKITTLYTERTPLQLADGSSIEAESGVIFGGKYPLSEDVGTSLPGTIISNRDYVYFYDTYNGAVYRKAKNGLQDISGKMSKYFREKAKSIIDAGDDNTVAAAVYDKLNDLYILTIGIAADGSGSGSLSISGSPYSYETVAFHEPSNGWLSFYSFAGERYAVIGQYTFSFKDNKVYVHYADDVERGEFYGTTYPAELETTMNADPMTVKDFDAIEVDADQIWAPSDDDGIIIHAAGIRYDEPINNDHFNPKMQSCLKENHFRYSNGIFKAGFLRDALTKTGSFFAYYLHEGRKLAGRYMTIRLKSTKTTKNTIRGVTIKYSITK
jgi:hypothetical protein